MTIIYDKLFNNTLEIFVMTPEGKVTFENYITNPSRKDTNRKKRAFYEYEMGCHSIDSFYKEDDYIHLRSIHHSC